jgi:uncharacterized protein (DUF488 family)
MCPGKPPATRGTQPARRNDAVGRLTLFTIGHSNHDASRFLELLSATGVTIVADVRRFPGSRRWPQFGLERFQARLEAAGIAYCWLPDLGGRRRLKDDGALHTGWKQAGFRAYAAHMHSEEFQSALAEVISIARVKRVALMCAEGLWWQCHRRLIADQLIAWGHNVIHIMPDGQLAEHVLTPFAVVRNDGQLSYPGPAQQSLYSAS